MALETVWKYKLPVQKDLALLMPVGAEILSVGVAGNELVLWAKVRINYEDTEVRRFAMVATGRNVPDGSAYVGTLIDLGTVWHLFETTEGST
jgi:hypothetical protein